MLQHYILFQYRIQKSVVELPGNTSYKNYDFFCCKNQYFYCGVWYCSVSHVKNRTQNSATFKVKVKLQVYKISGGTILGL